MSHPDKANRWAKTICHSTIKRHYGQSTIQSPINYLDPNIP